MKPKWQVSRSVGARSDGQRRWDYAYQFLLHWVMDNSPGGVPEPSPHQEDQHGNRTVRAGFDQSPATRADD